MTRRFRMQIEDVFQLGDGRTAIAGQIEGGESVMIQRGPAVVLQDGREIAKIEIESESLFSRSDMMARRELAP